MALRSSAGIFRQEAKRIAGNIASFIFKFCFDAVERGGTVAVSTLGALKAKDAFMRGFRELCRRLEPETVLCYCKAFEEMRALATIVELPYEGDTVRGRGVKGGAC